MPEIESDDPPASTATYIIICSGRINLDTSGTTAEKVRSASNCAVQLVAYLSATKPGQVQPADTQAISDLQHYLMDNWRTLTKKQVDAKCAEMFRLLDELEEKFED